MNTIPLCIMAGVLCGICFLLGMIYDALPDKRERYKAAALQGLLGNPNYTAGPIGFPADVFARDASTIADALIAEDEEARK